MNKTVNEIAQMVGGRVVGDGVTVITGVNGIREASAGDLTFVTNGPYLRYLSVTKASAILAPEGVTDSGRPIIQVRNPYLSFATILKSVEEEGLQHPVGIHPQAVVKDGVTLGQRVAIDACAVIESGCELGDDVVVYPGAYVGRNSTIGARTVIYPNVSIRERSVIGADCILHSNASIGSDGFGYAPFEGKPTKIPQVGRVVLSDGVEVGANSAIDRATCGETFIGAGTKIDNLVQVGHNVRVGEHCTISGNTGICGSARIGNRVTIGGQVGINGHIEVGDNTIVAARTGVTKSIPAGSTVSGFPAEDHATARRILVGQKLVPELQRRVRALEKQLEEVVREIHGSSTDDS